MTNYAKWALLAALLAMPAFSTSAAENNGETKQNTASSVIKTVAQSTTFGGYVIGSASLNNQEDAVHSNFQLRLARLYAKGKIGDFAYQLQMQVNGIGGSAGEKGPRIVDAWGEWQHFSFARIKFGQFKRAFLFENPMNPWDISFGAYSQITTKLSGMSDRCGEHDSNGRDIGIQLQGDLVPTADHSRHFIHYQIGLWTGNGINHADNNSHKDLMGGIYLMPLKGLNTLRALTSPWIANAGQPDLPTMASSLLAANMPTAMATRLATTMLKTIRGRIPTRARDGILWLELP